MRSGLAEEDRVGRVIIAGLHIARLMAKRNRAYAEAGRPSELSGPAGGEAMAGGLLTFDDCCRVILADWPWRQEDTAEPLREYKRHLLALMTAEFGVVWDDGWGEHDGGHAGEHPPGLSRLACGMPARYSRLRSPFDGLLEYTPQPGEQAALDAHSTALTKRLGLLRDTWVALFRDLLLVCWPDADKRTTTWERLRAKGLGEPVDELDFF
jgi:hypothetical protein